MALGTNPAFIFTPIQQMIWISWEGLSHTAWQHYLIDFCPCSLHYLRENNSQQMPSPSSSVSRYTCPASGTKQHLVVPSVLIPLQCYATNCSQAGIRSDSCSEINMSKKVIDGNKKQKHNSSFLTLTKKKQGKTTRHDLLNSNVFQNISKCFPKFPVEPFHS